MKILSLIFIVLAVSNFISCQHAPQEGFLQNKVIAHRGAWKNAGHPENSIASLREAIKLGCEGSEFDVWMTADDVLVVNHDPEFMGIPIETSNYEELLTKELPNGEKIPTLEAYLREGITQTKTKLILEIKASELGPERNQKLAEESLAMVKELNAEKWVDYISFDKGICRRIMELDTTARVAYLNGEKSPAELKKQNYYGLDYEFSVLKENPHWIEEAQQMGLTVNSWTINKKEDMQWLLERQVDFITTDEPELLLKLVKAE
jgi:glycerophosphoryl diester phosphodiesterase